MASSAAPTGDSPMASESQRLPRGPVLTMFRVPSYQLVEVRQLHRHMMARLGRLATSPEDHERLEDWLRSRFTFPMRSMMIEAKRGGVGYAALNLVVIGGGFATSGVAVAGNSGSKGQVLGWVVFALGLVVALAGGVNQLYRPGHRATERGVIVGQLREAGWAFANSLAPYDGEEQAAFEILDSRICDIHGRATALAAVEEQPLPTKRAAGRSNP